jgi:N-methylhydantoinase A
MEGALRRVSVERGYDPRGFTLVAFGGAGPLHACELAAALRVSRVVVPPHPGVLSAFGMATAPVLKELSAAVMATFGGDAGVGAQGLALLREVRDKIETTGRSELVEEGFATERLVVETFFEMRYAGQSYELSVPVESLEPTEFVPLFHDAHRELYGHADASRAVEVVTMRVRLVLPAVVGNRKTEDEKREESASDITRKVWFGGEEMKVALYDRKALAPRDRLAGPAIVVQMDSTTVVPPAWSAEVDAERNLVLEPS